MKTIFKFGCWSLIAIALLLPIVFSCGGSGGGGGGPIFTPTPASNVGAMAFTASGLESLGEELASVFTNLFSASSTTASPASESGFSLKNISLKMIKIAKNEVLSQTGLMGTQGSLDIEDIGICSPGSAAASLEWIGPEPPVSGCTDMVDLVATMTFTGCGFDGGTFDGTAVVRVEGNLCNPTDYSVQFTDFTANAGTESMSMGDLTVDFSRGATMQVVINGDMTASEGGPSYTVDFLDFTLESEELTATTGQSWITGQIDSTTCFSAPVIFVTPQPIQWDDALDCPTGGVVTTSGGVEGTLTFNSDGSVDILYDSETTTYPSCNDVPNVGGCSGVN